jgi:hypothetical protein
MVDSIEHLLKDAEALCDANGFEAFKKTYCIELGKSRAYELLAIRDGRKTLEEIRSDTRKRVAKHRAAKSCNGQVDSVTSLPVKVNGQAVDLGELGPAARAQIAEAIGDEIGADYTATVQRGLLNIASGIEPCSAENGEAVPEAKRSLADHLNEICNAALNICQDKSNWSPAVTEHEWIRIGKHTDAMRSSFQSLSKIAKKASERQAKRAKTAAGRVAA